MENKKLFEKDRKESRKPDFTSRNGVSIWRNLDKNGKEYLSMRIGLLGISENCFSTEGFIDGDVLDVKEEKVD